MAESDWEEVHKQAMVVSNDAPDWLLNNKHFSVVSMNEYLAIIYNKRGAREAFIERRRKACHVR